NAKLLHLTHTSQRGRAQAKAMASHRHPKAMVNTAVASHMNAHIGPDVMEVTMCGYMCAALEYKHIGGLCWRTKIRRADGVTGSPHAH
ncbi:hypothetical protein SARC_14710, partial [Sphaeroforma arctica JP610]